MLIVRIPWWNRMRALFLPVLATALLGACVSSPHSGRSQLTAPQPVSAAYSEINYQLQLIKIAEGDGACRLRDCETLQDFDRKVARLADRLAGKAYELYPDVRERVGQFEFVVADKSEPGSASTAAGTVAIFRGTRTLELSEEALAFVIAREMGHIICNHHDENTATSLLVSALAQVFLPITGILRSLPFLQGINGAATAAPSAAAGVSSAATATAASFVGSRAVIASYRPQQISEADTVALHLVAALGYTSGATSRALAAGLAAAEKHFVDGGWAGGLRVSLENVQNAVQGPELPFELRVPILDARADFPSRPGRSIRAEVMPALIVYPQTLSQ